jgi:ComF family protein
VETIDSYRCGGCEDEEPPFTAMRYSYPYEGPIRAMTLKFKYEQERSLGVPLARLAEERLGPWLDLIADEGEGVMIPVPLAVERLYARGFNPSYLIALEWGSRRGIPVAEGTLRRTKNTTPQFGLNAQQRATNVRGAFKLVDRGTVKGKKVILVDDIYTTGATIAECCKAVAKGAPAAIYVATLCRAGI